MPSNNLLGTYHIDLNKQLGEDFSEYQFSEQGVPFVRFNRRHDWKHNPVTVCQFALHQFNQFIRNSDLNSKQKFMNQVNWLTENHVDGPYKSAVWYYNIDIPFYKLKKPWISGMAQGEALSVLMRAYQLTNDIDYLNLAEKVWHIFSVPVDENGIIGNYADGSVVIEEYPTTPGSCVLNGFIFALFGLYDYALVSGNRSAYQLLEQGVVSLKANLHQYDSNYWSYYDLWKPLRLTSKSYHRLHIVLLKALSEIIKEESFLMTAMKWQSYLKKPLSYFHWGCHKIKYRLEHE